VYVQTQKRNDETLIALTITSTNDNADLLKLAAERCSKALQQGYASMMQATYTMVEKLLAAIECFGARYRRSKTI
jgi:hypothetical protein